MYIKKTYSKKKSYYSIVEGYRKDGKVKQRTILHLGAVDSEKDKKKIEQLAFKLLDLVESDALLLSSEEIWEIERLNWGIVSVYKALWQKFELDKILKSIWKRRVFEFNACNAVFLMLLDRVSMPCSKLKTFQRQSRYLGLEILSLQHLYRSLDLLADSKEEIEAALFHKNRSLFNMNVDVVF